MRFILDGPMKFYMPFGGGGGGGDEKEEKVSTEPSQASVDFHARFAASRPDVVLPPGTPGAAKEEGAEEPPEEKPEEKEAKPEAKPTLKKPPGSNIQKILEDKRKAEAERDELRTKAEKFEKEEKPVLEQKVADLEKQIEEGGHTKAERKALEEKLEAAEKRLQEREESLVNENTNLRSKLAFHDIQEDPSFQKEYVQPIAEAYTEAIDTFQGDEQKQLLLRKALLANGAALSATNKEDRVAQEKERNTVLSQISDSLDEFSRNQFTSAMNAYIRATKQHAGALSKHEETRAKIIKDRSEKSDSERTRIFSQWTTRNSQVAPAYDEEVKFDPELEEVLKELKIDPSKEVEMSAATVQKVITGKGSMEESLELLQRGRVYPALQAKVKGQQQIISGLKATIAKLKGSKPSGSSKDGRDGVEEKTGKEELNHRFRASRPGITRGGGGE